MNLRWKIGGGMAVIAALVSIAGSLAAYTSTDAELTHSVDNGLIDSAARVLNIPAERPNEEDDEDENDDESQKGNRSEERRVGKECRL